MSRDAQRCAIAPIAATIIAASAAAADIPDLQRAVDADPDSVSARLALARAYYDSGRYGDAKILFDTVLRFEDLPSDLKSQTEIYARAAQRYAANDVATEGGLVEFSYVEAGVGSYVVNSSPDTGDSSSSESVYGADFVAGLSYLFPSGTAFDAGFDYEARVWDSDATHNDSDVGGRVGMSRSLGEGNFDVALRARRVYLGDGDHRQDFGVSLDWHRALNVTNEIALGTFVRRREYPDGPLQERTRSIAEATADWTHSLADGAASFSSGVHVGQNYNTDRPEGDSRFYGATVGLDWPINERLGMDVSGEWEHNVFNTDYTHFHPDVVDQQDILRREDELYEIGVGVTWELATAWDFQGRIVYLNDRSNLDDFHYRSTEYWVSVRKSFAPE